MTPLVNLLAFALALAVAVIIVFAWRAGVLPRGRRDAGGRSVVEDALKHTFHNEDRGVATSIAGLAGTLGISMDRTVTLLERMEGAGLVALGGRGITLTDEGRRYAIQVIRAHRLWERYLADETGVAPEDWHARAERREHTMTAAEADALATRLGDPRFDPHGDPIPTSDGVVPRGGATTLCDLTPGESARIDHLEDEPPLVYAQLVAAGVYPGMAVDVEERSDSRIVCTADGRRFVLAPIVARNVSVTPLAAPARGDAAGEAPETLADISPGEVAEVIRIRPSCRAIERRRLMDLGIVPGTRIEFERRGLTGGLCAYRVRRTIVALRQEQARDIVVRRAAEMPRPSRERQAAGGNQ